MNSNTRHPRGSIYVTTLITVAAISTTILVGVKIRSASNTRSSLTQQMTESSQGILDATEYALQTIATDPAWAATAQTGVIFPKIEIDGTIYTGTVTDAETANELPTADTSQYRLRINTENGSATTTSTIDFLCQKVDYKSMLDPLKTSFYWKLTEQPGGSTAVDEYGDNDAEYLDPRVVGASTNDEGASVPVFNDDNDHIEAPYDPDFAKKKGSFTFWMKSTESRSLVTYGLLGMLYESGGPPNFHIVLFNRLLSAYVGDSDSFSLTQIAIASGGNEITLDTWHHVAVTYGSDGLTVYLDGSQVAQNTSNTSGIDSGKKKDGGEQPLKIGAADISVFFSYQEVGFKGSIAHVTHHKNCQLSADQVAELAAVRPDQSRAAIIEDSWAQVFE